MDRNRNRSFQIENQRSSCAGFFSYIKNRVFIKNWLDCKESLIITKKESCKCCIKRNNTVKQGSDSEEDEIELKEARKTSALRAAKAYATNGNDQTAPFDSLLFYIRQLEANKEEKFDFLFVSDLFKKGIKIDTCDVNGENALYKAVRIENDIIVSFLLEKNIDYMKINSNGCNIFHMSARNKSPVITRLIASKFQKETLNKYIESKSEDEQQTPLHYAAKKGSVSVAECLISEFGVNKEALDYKLRTPLYIAAEYGHQSMVKALMRLNCRVCYTDNEKTKTVNNIHGQSALYWIVSKMPDIAKEALDELHESNSYLRQERHYIAALEPSIPRDNVVPKSVLDEIVEKENLDLIEHPTIKCLINYKWRKFARLNAWIDFLFTLMIIALWITIVILFPSNSFRTSENLPILLALLIVGILLTVYLIVVEIREVYYEYKCQKKYNNYRRREIEEYKMTSKEKNVNKGFYIDERIKIEQNNLAKILINYITDVWNIYDWALVALLISCTVVSLNPSNFLKFSTIQVEVLALTIIFISLRVLKTSRILIPTLGTLILVFYYAIVRAFTWLIVFSVIWLSFSLSLWAIYGDKKYDVGSSDNDKCTNVYDEITNALNGCTVVTISDLETFGKTAYLLFKVTFGFDVPDDDMNTIDYQLTNPLVALYIALTSLVLINIYIGLLSAVFTRIYTKAEAFILLQRAVEIVNVEKRMSFIERSYRIKQLRKIGNPYTIRLEKEMLTYNDDRVANLENELVEQRKLLMNMSKELEYSNLSFKYQNNKTNSSLEDIMGKEAHMQEMFSRFLDEYRGNRELLQGQSSSLNQRTERNPISPTQVPIVPQSPPISPAFLPESFLPSSVMPALPDSILPPFNK